MKSLVRVIPAACARIYRNILDSLRSKMQGFRQSFTRWIYKRKKPFRVLSLSGISPAIIDKCIEMYKAAARHASTFSWNINPVSRAGYIQICKSAARDDSTFKVFKRLRMYRKILEHVTEEQGEAILDIIKKEGPELLEYFPKFKENDRQGSPITYAYEVGTFSPATLQYIKVLKDLRNIFGDLNNMDIIEIGGGYGGQAKIVSDVVDFRSYTVVDLDTVLPLVRKYLTNLAVKKIIYSREEDLSGDKKYDLVISNYAFSELVRSVQDAYLDKILSKAQRGYITYNDFTGKKRNSPYNKEQITRILSRNHQIHILEERPLTGPRNFIIVWDDIRGEIPGQGATGS